MIPKLMPKSLKFIYAYAHAADPVYSLRRNPLRHLTFETPFSRFYKVPIPWTQRHPRGPTPTPNPPRDPRGPKGPRGKGAKGGQGSPRGPKGPKGTKGDPRGPKGTQGRLRRPWGGWAHGALWGYSEAIPNGMPFRVDGYYEMKAVAKIMHSEMEATAFISNPLRNESRG